MSRQKISAQVRAHSTEIYEETFPLLEALPPGIAPRVRFVCAKRARVLKRRGVTITELSDGSRFWVWESASA